MTLRAGLYARVSTHDQQMLPLQLEAMRSCVGNRGWTLVLQIADMGSGSTERPYRRLLMKAARRHEIDALCAR